MTVSSTVYSKICSTNFQCSIDGTIFWWPEVVNSAPTYLLDLGATLMTDHYFLQSTTTIGLAQAFGSQLKKNVFACVRQEPISYGTCSGSSLCIKMGRTVFHKLNQLLRAIVCIKLPRLSSIGTKGTNRTAVLSFCPNQKCGK